MLYKGIAETIYATGAKTMSGAFDNTTAVVTAVSGMDTLAVTLADNAHGILAGSQLYISGFTNYPDGMRQVTAIAANSMTILTGDVGYIAEAQNSTTNAWCVGAYVADSDYYFLGCKLHLSAVGAASEDLTLTVDSKRGSAWDTLIFTQNTLGVTDLIYVPSEAILIPAGDVIKAAWANAGSKTWGFEIMISRQ